MLQVEACEPSLGKSTSEVACSRESLYCIVLYTLQYSRESVVMMQNGFTIISSYYNYYNNYYNNYIIQIIT